MVTATGNHGFKTPTNPQSIAIEENSAITKAICCIPLLGIIVSHNQDVSLTKKIDDEPKVFRIIELINIKNQYKVANAVRSLFTAALIISGIALGIIGYTIFPSCAAILLTLDAWLNMDAINQNNKLITELELTGSRPEVNGKIHSF